MSGATSLREAMQFLLRRDTGAWPSDFHGTKPMSLRELLAACQEPRFAEWINLSRGKAENESFSEEAQGIGTDGYNWFISTNANDEREALYKLTWDFDVVKTIKSPFDPDATHIGALGVRDGWVYVAIQRSTENRGIWKVSTDFSKSVFLRADALPDSDMFAWCDLNPHNGFLYTCAFDSPLTLRAYRDSGDGLVRVAEADIPLVQPTDYRPTTHVQGACFTAHHKWLAVCDDAGFADPFNSATWWVERIHCHSTISGTFLGRRLLPATTDESGSILEDVEITSTRNELEAICFAPLTSTSGRPVQVHVLELNNEEDSPDDFYLWHFSVPDPEAL